MLKSYSIITVSTVYHLWLSYSEMQREVRRGRRRRRGGGQQVRGLRLRVERRRGQGEFASYQSNTVNVKYVETVNFLKFDKCYTITLMKPKYTTLKQTQGENLTAKMTIYNRTRGTFAPTETAVASSGPRGGSGRGESEFNMYL